MPETEEVVTHAIVGGGIAGLYCAYHLKAGVKTATGETIRVYEASDRLGGRLQTWRIDPMMFRPSVADPEAHRIKVSDLLQPGNATADLSDILTAEFGPMRIEPDHQPYLRTLLTQLEIVDHTYGEPKKWTDLVAFPPYQGAPPDQPQFRLEGEEAEQSSLVELLLLALRRVFEMMTFDEKWIEQDTPWMICQPWTLQPALRPYEFTKEDKLYAEANFFWQEFKSPEYLRRSVWKRSLKSWIGLLDEPHYHFIYQHGVFRGAPLRDMGFWNLLGSVLTHMAAVKLRDWASFYHLLPDNPSATAWLIFWLRAIKSTDSLRGIRGGMDLIVHLLCRNKLGFKVEKQESAVRNYVVYRESTEEERADASKEVNGAGAEGMIGLSLNRKLIRIEEGTEAAGHDILLTFEIIPDEDSSDNTLTGYEVPKFLTVRVKEHVILALPKGPLQSVEFVSKDAKIPQALAQIFDSVSVIPLLKCFFLVADPFWEDNRAPSRFAHTTPTRELHYWKSADKQTGLMMIYTDRPGTQFWSDYLTKDLVKNSAKKGFLPDGIKTPRRYQEHATIWTWEHEKIKNGENGYEDPYPGWVNEKFQNDRLLRTFLLYAKDEGSELTTADQVLAAGLQDWGLKPYEGACHVWRSGSSTAEITEYLAAFSLRMDASESDKKIHICGEAYSDFQGFIEGALRSAARVLTGTSFSLDNAVLTGAAKTGVVPTTPRLVRAIQVRTEAT